MDIISKARFTVTQGSDEYRYTLYLLPSGATAYGNRHTVVLELDNGYNPSVFDARYDKRFNTAESFQRNALAFVRDQMAPDCVVTRID